MPIPRRRLLAGAPALAALMVGGAGGGSSVVVWRDPDCGCCAGWVRHMRAAAFTVHETVTAALTPVRHRLGTPTDLQSCHTALVDGFVLEGHVPASAVRRLLADRPAEIRGLSVPGMPIGSPGMEVPGQPGEDYDVIAFGADGYRAVFQHVRGTAS
jgi:hypothetical protein